MKFFSTLTKLLLFASFFGFSSSSFFFFFENEIAFSYQYCKYSLIRYKPFKKLEELYTDETTEQEFIEMWQDFLQTSSAQEQLTNWSTELENASLVLESIETGTDVPADPLESDPEYSWYINNVKPRMMDEDVLNVERDPSV